MIKGILFICFYCIAPIQYFILRNESKVKKNIILGATLPYEARQMPEVQAVCARFRRVQTGLLVLLTLAALPALALPGFAVSMTYLLFWIIAAMAAPNVAYALSNRKLQALQAERGWDVNAGSHQRVVDLREAACHDEKRSVWPFLPPLLVSVIPLLGAALFDRATSDFWGVMLGCGSIPLCIALFWGIYALMARKRADVVDGNTHRNAALSRIRRQNLRKAMLWLSWLTALFNLALWKLIDSTVALLVVSMVYLAAVILVAMVLEFKVRDLQARLTEQCGKGELVDEDRWWIFGMFYYNPNDRNLMVNSRTGMNSTCNLGRPAGKVIMGASLLVILLLPFLGFWMIAEEKTPPEIRVTEGAVEAVHTKREYTLELEKITSIELLEELPSCRRVVGTGMENLLKGCFILGEDNREAQFCLDPQAPPFLLIETAEGDCYLFGSRSGGEAKTAYDGIRAAMP